MENCTQFTDRQFKLTGAPPSPQKKKLNGPRSGCLDALRLTHIPKRIVLATNDPLCWPKINTSCSTILTTIGTETFNTSDLFTFFHQSPGGNASQGIACFFYRSASKEPISESTNGNQDTNDRNKLPRFPQNNGLWQELLCDVLPIRHT